MESVACGLCGADRPRRLHRNFDLDISRCAACGLVYAGPTRLSREETWSRYSATYFQQEYLPAFGVTNGEIHWAGFEARYARVLSRIARYRMLGTLLEVGSGAGFFLEVAKRAGWSVTGLEVMAAGVEFSRTVLDLTVLPAAIEDADLPEAGFDVVALFEVLEHVSNPRAVLSRVLTLLRPGGCVVLSTPNIKSLSHRVLGGHWAVLSPAEHLFYFSERSLQAMLAQAGFTDIAFDRHYAGAGRYETLLPTHSFFPAARRARIYKSAVDRLSPAALTWIQRRGWADGLHVVARRP